MLIALRIAEIATSLVVVGAAAALGYGMGLVGGGTPSSWATTPNLILLLSDAFLGMLMIYFAVSSRERATLALAAAVVLAVTHLYRAIEFFLDVAQPFASNIGLFLLNDLKLIGAVAIVVLWARMRSD
jgi:hypothetical protein